MMRECSDWVWRHANVSGPLQHILLAMAARCDHNWGMTYLSTDEIAQWTGLNEWLCAAAFEELRTTRPPVMAVSGEPGSRFYQVHIRACECAPSDPLDYGGPECRPWVRVPKPGEKRRIPHGLQRRVHERDAYRCRTCGGFADLTVDHIMPESLGGTIDLDNLQTLCRSCNSRKGARHRSDGANA